LSEPLLITDKIPLLVVDDDAEVDTSVYTDSILSAEDYDFISYNVAEQAPPDTELLNKFPLVVWFTGGGSTLSSLEQDALSSYLNNGGYLLIFSNTLGRDIGDTGFYHDYLCSDFWRVSQSLTIEGRFRDVIGRGLLFSILEAGEEVKPVAPATESLSYSGGESAAIKADNGMFKVVYFTFGLEDVPDAATRNALLKRSLQYFDIDVIPPVITDISPPKGTKFPINTTQVTLTLRTDEVSECRISDVTRVFDEMEPFDSTNSLSHTMQLTNLTEGKNFTFFINCRDRFANQNNTEQVSFYIYNRTFLPPPVVEPIADITVFENETVTIFITPQTLKMIL
jgi:hypothetical protein